MIVCAHQPTFLPWAGFWHKVLSADRWIVWAGATYAHKSVDRRVSLEGSWLSMTVASRFKDQPIYEVMYEQPEDLKRIAARIEQVFLSKKARHRYPYADRVERIVESLLGQKVPQFLLEVNLDLILAMAKEMGVDLVSKMEVDTELRSSLGKTEAILAAIREHAPDCTLYLTGVGALDFMELEKFSMRVGAQDPPPMASPDSVLAVIAGVLDPAEYLKNWGSWRVVR